MTVRDIVVPSVGESITDVTLGPWARKQGERVRRDETVVLIESDKATLEVPAPADGLLLEVLKPEGAAAKVGEVIARVEESAAPVGEPSAPAPAAVEAPPKAAPVASPVVMPAAARVLAEAGLSASDAAPTGPGGRLLKEDAIKAVAAPRAVARAEEVVPMTTLRKRIAERLVQAKQDAALLTTFNEVDMSAVMQLRKQHGEGFKERHGVKLGFMSFFVRASVDALRAFPAINAEIRGTDIVYKHYFDIGVAVGSGKGLVVPVLRDADRMGFAEIEKAIADFGTRAQAGKLNPDEMQGGTFTISNGGIYGSMLSTPIVNPPQSAVLGMHAIQERPVGVDGQVVLRPMMYLALTYDHRLVDGREAVTFLRRIKDCLESPARMLLEV
ncbi:MAG: 2-oxoglutarate dehydrogenase complex dihydrolipoyllysine-residue succinyltransferase [Candidatus Sericytochromatia bacterium]|nr:2-oxoglutarate dehydrogenase complex dihydrolipoyllysine-residue succinyltransferase [Candidatus Sericytochromatia bacterium]